MSSGSLKYNFGKPSKPRSNDEFNQIRPRDPFQDEQPTTPSVSIEEFLTLKHNVDSLSSKIDDLSNEFKKIYVLINDLAGQNQPSRQVTTTKTSNRELAVAIQKEVQMAIVSHIDKEVKPLIKRTMEYVKYKVGDDDEIITEFRHRVQSAHGGPINAKITMGGKPTRSEIQKTQFAFTDQD